MTHWISTTTFIGETQELVQVSTEYLEVNQPQVFQVLAQLLSQTNFLNWELLPGQKSRLWIKQSKNITSR